MALIFPRPMPCGVQTIEFEIARAVSKNALYGGTTQVREMGEARWRASFSYAPMKREQFQALQAWLDSLRGGLRTFLGHDALKPYPLAYRGGFGGLLRAGGGAFDGTGSVVSIGTDTISVGQMPAGFVLRAGDMIGLVEGGRYGLFRILEDVSANGAGSLAVTVEPRIVPGLFTIAARASFSRPSCLMTLDADSISASRTAMIRAPISFSGIQKIY